MRTSLFEVWDLFAVGDDGAQSLAEALTKKAREGSAKLDLRGHDIGKTGAEVLVKAAAESGREVSLDLRDNPIGACAALQRHCPGSPGCVVKC